MILPTILYGNPILRKKGKKVGKIDEKIRKLVKDLLETMREAKGVGLAAQQVGEALQVAVVDVTGVEDRPSKMWIDQKEVDPADHMPVILINPEISLIKTKETGWEGCLSFPGVDAEISRSKRVKVKALQPDGSIFEFEAGGLLGRAVQHEYDHIHGILLNDRMPAETRKALKEQLNSVKEQGKAQ